MVSMKRLTLCLMVTLVALLFLTSDTDAKSGPMLILKAGKKIGRRHGKGGGGGLATLLAAGVVAKLLQHGSYGGGGGFGGFGGFGGSRGSRGLQNQQHFQNQQNYQKIQPMFIAVPILEEGRVGYGGSMGGHQIDWW